MQTFGCPVALCMVALSSTSDNVLVDTDGARNRESSVPVSTRQPRASPINSGFDKDLLINLDPARVVVRDVTFELGRFLDLARIR